MENLKKLTQKELQDMHESDGRTYLVMVPYGWGKDTNAAKAFRIARSHGAYFKPREKAVVFSAPDDAYVDGMGTIRWENAEHSVTPVGEVHFRR